MLHLCVIADDFTGALETGAQFAKKGISTWLQLDASSSVSAKALENEVLVVNTESRHMDPEEASRKVYYTARNAQKYGITRIYKKTDSTLRGNIGAELEALIKAVNSDSIVFLPAYPKAGRLTIGGRQFIGHIPIHETDIGEDPFDPKTTSVIPEILAEQTRLKTHVVDHNITLERLSDVLEGIILFDCARQNELEKIGKLLRKTDRLNVIAGSSGFAELLPELLEMEQRPSHFTARRRPLLVLNGSLSDVSLGQTAFARETGIIEIIIPPGVLFHETEIKGAAGSAIVQQAVECLESDKPVMLRTVAERSELHEYLARSGLSTINPKRLHLLAANHMGVLIRSILQHKVLCTLAVFGGDTLRGVASHLKLDGLRLLDEITTGVALSEIEWKGNSIQLVSKSGAFGQRDVVARILEYLRGPHTLP